MQVAVLAVLLPLAAFPPERDVAVPVPGFNPGSTGISALVPTPAGFFALYYDDRSMDGTGTRVGHRGARLTSALEVLEPTGVPLPVPAGAYGLGGVHDGSAVRLHWLEQPAASSYLLRAARVTEAGAVLVNPLTVTTSTIPIRRVVSAWDGRRLLIAWLEEGSASSVIKAAALSASGVLTGPWTLFQGSPQDLTVASSAGVTLVAWIAYRPSNASTLEVMRVPQGAAPPASPTVLLTRGGLGYVSATATTNGAWYLAWSETPAAGTIEVSGAALPATGALGAPISIQALSSQYAIKPRVGFSGSDVRVVWTVYLDIRARTVPLAGAPTTPVQLLRSSLPFEPGAGLACSGVTCVVEWEESAPGGGLASAARVTRLSAASEAVDVPAKEISFPADAHGTPTLRFDGQATGVLFNRYTARSVPELLVRRLSATGAWLGDPRVLGTNMEHAASAEVPGGGVLIASRAPFLSSDNSIHGQLLTTAGGVSDAGVWVTPYNRPFDVHLACGTSRCGLLYEQSQGYLSAVLDHSGAVLQASNIYVSTLSQADSVRLHAVGGTLAVVYARYGYPLRVALAADTAFPSFGTPIAVTSGTDEPSGGALVASQGQHLAMIWTERTGCDFKGRLLDVGTGALVGTGSRVVHPCPTALTTAVQLAPAAGGGYTLFYKETGERDGKSYADYFARELDAQLGQVGAPRLLGSAGADLQGFAWTRVAGRDVYGYSRFDDSPGVLSRRAKLAGLDDGGTVDAGTPDAGLDGGWNDAGSDAGVTDAGVADAGPEADAGEVAPPDAGGVVNGPGGGSEVTGPTPGCGCGSAPIGLLPLAALGLGLRYSRRKRRVSSTTAL